MNNYHTHTYRCGHGFGSEEDMVLNAIKTGVNELGFSEHVPLPHYRMFLLKSLIHALTDLHSILSLIKSIILNGPGMRMPYKTRYDHEKIVKDLKNKYKHQIKIYQGYECEYFKEYLPYYKKLLDNHEVDYLILGNHFDKYPIHNRYYGKKGISDKMLLDYKDDVINAIHTGLFSYIAHPDLFLFGKNHFDSLCKEITYDICKEAKKYNMPLEINAGGIRKGYIKMEGKDVFPYTNDYFFQIASEIGNDIILGIDAHHPDHFNKEIVQQLYAFAKKNNLHVIHKMKIKEKEFII